MDDYPKPSDYILRHRKGIEYGNFESEDDLVNRFIEDLTPHGVKIGFMAWKGNVILVFASSDAKNKTVMWHPMTVEEAALMRQGLTRAIEHAPQLAIVDDGVTDAESD